MAHRVTIASMLLALTLPAIAQERFAVSGDDFAGVATLNGQQLEVRGVKFTRKDKRGIPTSFSLTVQQGGGMSVSLQGGATAPGGGSLARSGSGFTGTLGGLPVRLVPEAAPPADLAVLVVPGLSTNLWNEIGVEYLVENLAVLAARGYSARRLAINTEASIAENANAIAAEIRKEQAAGKRVLLLAHSKGGADTITALADPKNAGLLPKVVGLIAIQPVYAGSLVADFVGKSSFNEALAKAAFECVFPRISSVSDHGSVNAVLDLQTEARAALLAKHPYPAATIPTVTIRGSFDGRWKSTDINRLRKRHALCKPLVAIQPIIKQRRYMDSDGLVALPHQVIPGAKADFVYDDLDHFEPGFRSESPHTPSAITAKALELMLPHLKK